jgi:hypothetical protein
MLGAPRLLLLWLGLSFFLALVFAIAPLPPTETDVSGPPRAPELYSRGEARVERASKMHHAIMSEPAAASMPMPMPPQADFAGDAGGSWAGGGGASSTVLNAPVVDAMRAVPAPPPPAGALSGPVVLKSGSLEASLLPGAVPSAAAALEALAAPLKGFVEASNSYTDAWLLTRPRRARRCPPRRRRRLPRAPPRRRTRASR